MFLNIYKSYVLKFFILRNQYDVNMIHPMHAKVSINLLLIYSESLVRQNDSINALETTINEKKGKFLLITLLYILLNNQN